MQIPFFMLDKQFLILILIGAVTIACNTTKPLASAPKIDTTNCQYVATMLDYTTNTNCQFLLQLEDGTKLLPAVMPVVEIPFYADNKVIIGYKEIEYNKSKTISDCGAEDKTVEITCMEIYVDPNDADPKSHEECKPVANIFKSTWMREVVEELKPQKVFEYEYAVGYLYLFKKNEVSTLFDCLGNSMCSTADGGDCNSLIETLGKEKLIQVLKN